MKMSDRHKTKITINEEELIRQISLRPILYDRSLKAYRKLSLRHQYWKQVGEIMGCSVEGCRRRWRSLRDSFAKRHKNANRMQIKWQFYKQMTFIAPYLDNSSGEIDDQLDDFADNSNDADIVDKPESHMESIKVESTTTTHMPIMTSEVSISKNMENVENNEEQAASIITSKTQSQHSDSDEKFLLSCAPVLGRLSARKNALARLKIQQLLYEIEFDEQLNDCL